VNQNGAVLNTLVQARWAVIAAKRLLKHLPTRPRQQSGGDLRFIRFLIPWLRLFEATGGQ